MARSTVLGLILAALAGGSWITHAGTRQQEPAAESGAIEWRTDLAQAQVEAARDRRPLLVVFR